MHRSHLLACALPTALLLLLPGTARAQEAQPSPAGTAAEEGEPASDDRAIDWTEWAPAASGGIGISSQQVESGVRGRFSTVWDQNFPGGQPALLQDSFEKALAGPYFPFSVEVMGPTLRRLPGRPRLFVQGGYGWSREEKNLLARAYIADLFDAPGGATPETAMQVFAKPEDLLLAGLGSSFEFELGDYPVYFRPSLNFFAQRTVMDANLVLERTNPGPPITQETLRTTTRDDQWFYYVGPQLEFDVEVGRQGAVGFRVFANTSLRFSISDRSMLIQGLAPTADGIPDSYSLEYDNLMVTGSAGLRLVWHGAE
jgi:hypothetical protein